MFKNKKSKIDPNMTDTLIGEGTHFEGKIRSEAGIRIEGHLTGDIECTGDVTIGENGSARSNVRARHVILAGQVTGNVIASGKLTIKATGKLLGNLTAQELSIESGGIFQGSSKMETGKEIAATDETDSANSVSPAADAASTAVLKTW
ncbi:bactofilin family protein [Cohnella candidum]|uniref:Polymer-forming cytoskeletal protein n=1 Tax=Cohnella candidum TaxID=2674991 RepID=A0A3G3JSL0_9BACL|nr:polymer-forming cytoskeletal protein [Cohnella candidum]AYQ71210.1 polymer-forming cytoskeletal protein [Cohnella candidum]